MQLNNKGILIIKPSSLGDIIHTLPVVHAIKRSFPDCSIGWVVQRSFAPLLEADDSIDTVYPIHIPSTSDPHAGRWSWFKALHATISTIQELRRQFQQHPYDLVLDLHASLRSGLLGRTNPGGQRVGFSDAKELNTFFQNHLINIPATTKHAQEKNLLFCKYMGANVRDEDFYLCTSEDDRQTVQQFLLSHKIDRNDTNGADPSISIVYANPAARWQSKFWPVKYWAKLADMLHDKEVPMFFGGGAQDKEYIASIAQHMTTEPLIAAGQLTLPQSVALIQRASLYIGLDSGPMHIAALTGTPVVALFGPTHPDKVGPYSLGKNKHRILRATGLDCLECRKRKCSHCSCMQQISPEAVYESALSLL
ncbi:glycosyltransferase family 9 protein [Candidatus Electrothrix sp.]|uniref:glycosyltransferase family 9 protein n=1 Tax=Candidatus Electrothrix sp. TaxID=2170559 RepID=UPI0040575934